MNKRKGSIVEHSLSLFLENGIQNTSIQDIIDRAGISKGTFYNYFASKNECVSAILEHIHLEAQLSRNDLLTGKDAKDLDLLIEQVAILLQLNERRGMNAIYEEILYLGDHELKQLMLKYRMMELEWLAERFIEVFGESIRPHAFESSVIFYGILHNLLFTHKLLTHSSHQSQSDLKSIAKSVFYYMDGIIHGLVHHDTAVLDPEHLVTLKDQLDQQPVQKSDAVKSLKNVINESWLSKEQKDLSQALLYELEQQEIRPTVISALLQPFTEIFENSPQAQNIKEISALVWHYLRT